MKWLKPIRVNGKSAWAESVTITARTASGESALSAMFKGVVQDEEHPFNVEVSQEEVRGGIGNVVQAVGYAHVKMDFWVKDLCIQDL